MSRLERTLAVIVLLAVVASVAYWRGWIGGRAAEKAEWVTKEAEWVAEREEVRRQARAERDKGRLIADKLSEELGQAKAEIGSLKERIQHEINRTTSAKRACLASSTTRMLNETSVIRERVHPSSSATAGTVAPATAAPPDTGGYSSERAVATALNEARTGYETCRSQLHRLIDWVESVTN